MTCDFTGEAGCSSVHGGPSRRHGHDSAQSCRATTNGWPAAYICTLLTRSADS